MTKIGEGGFGIVYKDLDLSEFTIFAYNGSTSKGKNNEELNKKCVYKLFIDSKDLETEANNNLEIYKLLQDNNLNIKNLTPLYENIKKIRTPVDSFLVYSLFEKGDLQSYLFPNQLKKYVQEYDYTQKHAVDMFKFIKNALTLLNILHTKGYIHMDIKLDNFLVRDDNCDDNSIVLADYGQLTQLTDVQISYTQLFIGMEDYMPPFCHYTGLENAKDSYIQLISF